ncbi:NUDIX domain-containing protein [Polaribacter sp.]|nr:NUDIX domain-containing protein [Polaribacter sp.]|tara:strand:- start:648 stop:1055 length:408 start_codon:yes stop_codon:yes gene_type:complete
MKIKNHKYKSKLLIVEDSSMFVLQKKEEKKRFVLVGGFLKKRESPEEGLIREVYEETGVNLTNENIKYYASTTIVDSNKNALTRHYFLLIKNGQKYENKEPDKFKSLKWVKWTKAIKFINSSDKNVIERLFNSIS